MRKDGKKLALEFLSQKGRLKGNTLVFRCIESCFKGRSSSFFFSTPTISRIEIVSFSCN